MSDDTPSTDVVVTKAPRVPKTAGYHLTEIVRGEFGEISKIFEEVDEFEDATRQGVSLMQLQELSDLMGAISGWLAAYHPSITIDDLIKMAKVTKRAFDSGHRESRS